MSNTMKKRGMLPTCGALARAIAWLMLAWWTAVPAYAQREEIESRVVTQSRPYEAFIVLAAAKYGVDPFLLRVVGYLETRFNPAAVSKRGARGMMQFMPATASRYGLRNPHHPQASIDAAARYLRDLAVRFDHRADLVLAAYNSGEGTVEAYRKGLRIVTGKRIINPNGIITGGIPPYQETRAYVARGIELLRKLRSNSAFLTQAKPDSDQEQHDKVPRVYDRHSIRTTNQPESSRGELSAQNRARRRSIYFGKEDEE
ncbi:MAG: lytic transglycosylase domain-containing protein [Acidobacteria bacterium]|nr:lytic transglycosylase domain-containing protein [Acidobacteriota bacterium]